MEEIVISVRNLSKRFGLYSSPAERLTEIFCPFVTKNCAEIWALKDVSFDVIRGQTLGIIGRNGSGKSTLLQVLCGILKPTLGEVTVNGRVSALLELGAGFHPEFSGRDNVYMNGAIMGLSRREVDKRFEEITDFAEIGQYIDQPVRTYSSGMFVRLAFACAVNIAPDILIVDEALAVGDAYFRQKCTKKIAEFRKEGGSMLLVSHDMTVIKTSCDSAILLQKGAILERGDPGKIADAYSVTKA